VTAGFTAMHRRTIGLTLGTILVAGCYVQQPVPGGALAPGKPVAFDITDAGRVALGGSMGPSVLHIEGRLLRRSNEDYVVAVESVQYLGGGTQAWSGEPVTLKPEYVGVTYERRLSKSRTIALSAAGIGALAAIVTTSLVGSGTHGGEEPPGPGGTTILPRHP
jgi:hypothetical protein